MRADLLRVLGLWRARRGGLLFGLLVAMASALSGVALMALAGKGVSAGVAAGAAGAMLLSGAVALLWVRPFVAIRPAMRWWERMASHAAAFRALADTRVWFFRRLAERMPGGIGAGGRGSGDLLGRLVSDVDALDRLYLGALVPAAAGFAVVVAVALLLGAEPALLALVALPLALALLVPLLLAPAAARAANAAAERRGLLRAAAVDPLLGAEDVLAAGAEARARERLREADAALMAAQRDVSRKGALAGALGSTLTQAALLGALGFGLWAGGGAGAALAVLALFLCVAASEALGLMPRAGAMLATAAAGARRLFEAADTAPPVAAPAAPAPLPQGHALRLEGVTFRYPGRDEPALDGADLELREGERVAVLGPSGAGKSTLAALALRLADPQGGRVTLGGADIRALDPGDLRSAIACLSQDARIFDDTIAANLRLAAPGAPDAALWRALAKAGLAETVRAMPEGLETRCGEGGAALSGGQARRLALARALLPPSKILVLDEPTAGLDAETERAFLATLDGAAEGRSLLLVTHRLTGVERMDRALRLAGGRLVPAAG